MNKRLHTRYVECWLHNNKRGKGSSNPLSCGELLTMVTCVRIENIRRRIIFPIIVLSFIGFFAALQNASATGVTACVITFLPFFAFYVCTKDEIKHIDGKNMTLVLDFIRERNNLLRLTRNCKPLREGLRDGTLAQFKSKHECSYLVHLKTQADQTPGCMWLQNEYRALTEAVKQFGVIPKPSRTLPPMPELVEALAEIGKPSE